MRKWDVWTVYWEHLDPGAQTEGKFRPAVLVSSPDEIAAGTFRFMKITTQPQRPEIPALTLDRNEGDEFTVTGLRKSPSYILYAMIRVLPKENIGVHCGHLGVNTGNKIIDLLRDWVKKHQQR